MSKALSTQRSAFSGIKAPGLDLRAVDELGIRRLETDSRRVKHGETFVAYLGEKLDGRRFIPQAIANGAHAVLWEKRGFKWRPAWRVPNYGVAGLRAKAGLIASHVYNYPSGRLWMVGVTGTNDNPRNEDPSLIIDDILAGMEGKAEIELDRRRAIKNAISKACYGDVVLIAGKGHETYQEEKGMRYAFSDIGVARELLKEAAK